MDKQAILAINRRLTQRFIGNRNQTRPFLAGTFGQQLLQPHAQRGHALRHEERHFIVPLPRQFTQHAAQRQAVLARTQAIAALISALIVRRRIDALDLVRVLKTRE